MRIYQIILLFVLLCAPRMLWAQADETEKNPRILILLDGSSSMLHEWTKDNIRFQAAAKIIDRLMDSVYSVNKEVEFALRVYGHQSPTSANNCYDSKLEVMFSRDNYTQMQLRLAALHPLGISPIAYSIQKAAEEDMPNLRDNKYSLILITDGGESCEGDICKVVEELLRKKIDFKPYILSLVDYAPLRKQYECMGEFLLVTNPDEIDPVVGKIVDAYRSTFIRPRAVTQAIETSRKTPSVLKLSTPEFKVKIPDPEPEPEKKPEPKKEVVVAKPAPPPPPPPVKAPPPRQEPAPRPSKIVVSEVLPKPKHTIAELSPSRLRILPTIRRSAILNKMDVPTVVITLPDPEPERPKEPVYKPMASAPITHIKTPVATKPVKAPKPMEFSITREAAAETSFELYFWDGRGKYYQSAPEVVLRDVKTNEPVHKFYRDLDVYGNPRPQKDIKPGVYNMTFTGKDGFMVANVEIFANEKNKLKVIVPMGSLTFTYGQNPSRPVSEFNARVSLALVRNNVTVQKCTDLLPYESGNYHIELNTNPRTHINVDLDFGLMVAINVEEPGKVKVFNPKGFKSDFHYQHGERYEQFQPLNVTGNAREFEFLIQPGRYKIYYIADPLVPNPKPKVKEFIIKSNTITELTLD